MSIAAEKKNIVVGLTNTSIFAESLPTSLSSPESYPPSLGREEEVGPVVCTQGSGKKNPCEVPDFLVDIKLTCFGHVPSKINRGDHRHGVGLTRGNEESGFEAG